MLYTYGLWANKKCCLLRTFVSRPPPPLWRLALFSVPLHASCIVRAGGVGVLRQRYDPADPEGLMSEGHLHHHPKRVRRPSSKMLGRDSGGEEDWEEEEEAEDAERERRAKEEEEEEDWEEEKEVREGGVVFGLWNPRGGGVLLLVLVLVLACFVLIGG